MIEQSNIFISIKYIILIILFNNIKYLNYLFCIKKGYMLNFFNQYPNYILSIFFSFYLKKHEKQ